MVLGTFMGYCFEWTLFQFDAVLYIKILIDSTRIPVFHRSNRWKKDNFDSFTPLTLSLIGINANMCLILSK